ncbi:MAG: DNA-3-methyladenine glycosylase, partial [Bacteroidetes bacterium]|nr:DNA-3-methyladenine glycosylase [Bacteroidota bacterium]
MLSIIPISFYSSPDVVSIARNLLGKIIETRIDGRVTRGRIVETEAYVAFTDKASHAYQ